MHTRYYFGNSVVARAECRTCQKGKFKADQFHRDVACCSQPSCSLAGNTLVGDTLTTQGECVVLYCKTYLTYVQEACEATFSELPSFGSTFLTKRNYCDCIQNTYRGASSSCGSNSICSKGSSLGQSPVCAGVACTSDPSLATKLQDKRGCTQCSDGYIPDQTTTRHTYTDRRIGRLCDNSGSECANLDSTRLWRRAQPRCDLPPAIHPLSSSICTDSSCAEGFSDLLGTSDQRTYWCEKETTRKVKSYATGCKIGTTTTTLQYTTTSSTTTTTTATETSSTLTLSTTSTKTETTTSTTTKTSTTISVTTSTTTKTETLSTTTTTTATETSTSTTASSFSVDSVTEQDTDASIILSKNINSIGSSNITANAKRNGRTTTALIAMLVVLAILLLLVGVVYKRNVHRNLLARYRYRCIHSFYCLSSTACTHTLPHAITYTHVDFLFYQ